jgi:cytochrome P450
MDVKWPIAMIPYGERWRHARKLFHAHVHQGVADRYHPAQLDAARRFIRDILATRRDKEALPKAVRANFGRSIIKMTYGIDVADDESEFISLPEKVNQGIIDAGTPGRFLVDFLPFCAW